MTTAPPGPSLTPEQLAYWYFRINGCLTITNFVLHPDLIERGELPTQRTDADVLAVRFPYRQELLTSGRAMVDDRVFRHDKMVDLIIAEVKTGLCRLNGPWTDRHKQNVHRVLYSVGVFPPALVPSVAEALYAESQYADAVARVRLFAVGGQANSQLPSTVVQLTFSQIAEFVYRRFRRYLRHKVHHPQWDRAGQFLYQQAANSNSEQEFAQKVLQFAGS
jgi:hypothetical protein